MKKNKTVIMKGIVKHSDGVGFKITFQDRETANYYKDMMYYIIKTDGYKIKYLKGYYDNFIKKK